MRFLVTLFMEGVAGIFGSVGPAASLAFFGVVPVFFAAESPLPLAEVPKGRPYFFLRAATLLVTERGLPKPSSSATLVLSIYWMAPVSLGMDRLGTWPLIRLCSLLGCQFKGGNYSRGTLTEMKPLVVLRKQQMRKLISVAVIVPVPVPVPVPAAGASLSDMMAVIRNQTRCVNN